MLPRGFLQAWPQAPLNSCSIQSCHRTLFGSSTFGRRGFRPYTTKWAPGPPMKGGPGVPLALMPIGGSVTYGVGSSKGDGYRKPLLDLLEINGLVVRMVGSRKTGSMGTNRHEGWRGMRIDQIEKKARMSVSKFLPEIFTLNAGSNDCLQSHEMDKLGFRNRMLDLLECLWSSSPGSTIILSTLIANADKDLDPQFEHANSQLRDLAQDMSELQRKIVLADMRSPEGPVVDDLVDGTHPNDAGYDKMAKIWLSAILEAESKGFLPEASKFRT